MLEIKKLWPVQPPLAMSTSQLEETPVPVPCNASWESGSLAKQAIQRLGSHESVDRLPDEPDGLAHPEPAGPGRVPRVVPVPVGRGAGVRGLLGSLRCRAQGARPGVNSESASLGAA